MMVVWRVVLTDKLWVGETVEPSADVKAVN